jgi:hypothetical protein
MRTWFRGCQSSHTNCTPKAATLPTRLLEVGSQNGRHPRLVYSDDLADRNPEYATLSYCWGDILPICTLRATEAAMRRQIPYHSLPRTFQDAIDIARVLRISYIWIDALCIVQDDHADWEREANRMKQVYSGSALTITASGARDSSEGFFAHEPPRGSFGSAPFTRVHFTFDNPMTGKTMLVQVQDHGGSSGGMAPILQTREWALQESVLSNRVIQCVESELFWRCNHVCQTECGLSLPTNTTWSWNVPVLDLKDVSSLHEVWRKLVEDYSGRSFTLQKDRLPAMAGLVSHFQEATNDLPCLGMWNRTLPHDLAWMRTGRLQNPQSSSGAEWNLPSWTWFSCPVSIIFEPEAVNAPSELRETPVTVLSHVKIEEWQVFWEGVPSVSKLKSTRLLVEGPVQELLIEIPTEAKDFIPPYCVINNKFHDNSGSPLPWCSSVQFDTEEWKPMKLWTCLLLKSTSYLRGEEEHRYETFLLLEPVSSDTEGFTFRRVGIGISRDNDNVFDSAVRRIVRLV